jgi:glucokinase
VAVTEPEIIVIGGSIGTYFNNYGDKLNEYLKNLETPLMPMPRVEGAKRPEEAVIYGCYDYAKEVFAKNI